MYVLSHAAPNHQKENIFIATALKTFCLAFVKEIVSFTPIEVRENGFEMIVGDLTTAT